MYKTIAYKALNVHLVKLAQDDKQDSVATNYMAKSQQRILCC